MTTPTPDNQQAAEDWASGKARELITEEWPFLRENVAAALREARAEALEQAARINEDTVTFTEDHLNRDGLDPCGWCTGLETAAAKIRALAARGEHSDE